MQANFASLNPMQGPPAPPVSLPPAGPPLPPPQVGPPASFAPPKEPNSSSINMSVQPPPTPTPSVSAPQPPGIRVINGASTPAHERAGIGPTQAALLGKASETERNAAGDVHDSERTQMLHNAMGASVREDEAREEMRVQGKARADHVAELDRIQGDIANDVKQLGSMKVDNNQFYKNAGTGGTISAILGAALMNGAAVLRGSGGTPGSDMLNKLIDRDVAAQRAAIEDKKAGIQTKQSQFGVLAQKYGMSGAESIWKQAALDKAAAQADQIAASNGIAKSDQNYATIMGTIGAARAKEQAQSIQYVQAHGGGQQVFDPRIGVPMSVPEYAKWKAANVGATDLEGVKHEGAVELKMLENEGKKTDKSQEEAAKIAEARERAKLPQGQAMLARAQTDLSKAPNISLVKKGVQSALPGFIGRSPLVQSALYNKDEAAREQSHQAVVNKYINDVTGSGGGEKEMERIQQAAGAAAIDPAARRRFYADMAEWYQAQERNIRAGASSAGKRAFDTSMQAEQPTSIREYR